jgi:phycoerythrin-associated linker protein
MTFCLKYSLISQELLNMVSTFAIKPVFLSSDDDSMDIESLINAIYRQVLGNAYVMESERLVVPESQLKSKEISVREFVRRVAKSELYRSRFFDNCYRYRAIELNFKHLLGRAPANFEEMRTHSNILDQGGHDAEIDSYLDSYEYQEAFGEMIIPFERGMTTQTGLSMQSVTNTRNLQRGAAGSDKEITTDNRPRLQKVLIGNSVKPIFTDVGAMLADLFRQSTVVAPAYIPQPILPVTKKTDEPNVGIQAQIDALRPLANIGSAILSKGSSPSTGEDSLLAQLAEARALASIAEYRLNKWRSRSY